MRNNYLLDLPAMRLGRLDDGNVRFARLSRPAPDGPMRERDPKARA
jgi:hypothetical protein